MPGVARSGDKGFTGHKCSRIAKVGSRSPSVFANGRLISRKNDPIQTHNILKVVEGKAYCLRHRARVLQGSPNVFVGRKRVACLGHKMDTIKGRIFQSSNKRITRNINNKSFSLQQFVFISFNIIFVMTSCLKYITPAAVTQRQIRCNHVLKFNETHMKYNM